MASSGLDQTFANIRDGLKAATILKNGHAMPWLGLGVWQMRSDAETERNVRHAIDAGYRSIDTASAYENERGVGQAVRGCGVPREELFITTKVWNDDVRAERVEEACEESLRQLGLDYVDLYLVHWPIKGKIRSTWRAMERLHAAGKARSIGVSNHLQPHLDELLKEESGMIPAVNQIELHPYLQSRELVAYCREHDIQVEAWSPLMQGGDLLQDPVLVEIARRHGRTVAQVILRWDVQRGFVTIPKSARKERIAENAAVFDFTLSAADVAAIDALDRGQRAGPDPMNFAF